MEKTYRLAPIPHSVLDHIALSFSGGGFRASSFALGTLSLFNELKIDDSGATLLQKVRYMSSASGGTVTTAMYALSSVRQRPFDEFYKELYTQTSGRRLLDTALGILTDHKRWTTGSGCEKNRNIINAFALAYDEMLFKNATIGTLKEGRVNTHLDELCFNTTEFYRGLLYRQTADLTDKGELDGGDAKFLFGNFMMHLDHDAGSMIKLADALAASSCFPGGFEPIVFPGDFVYPGGPDIRYFADRLNIKLQTKNISELRSLFGKDLSEEQLLANQYILLHDGDRSRLKYADGHPEIAFMDGGITDNLGVESMMQANARRARKGHFDLMMTNDVGSHFIDPYQVATVHSGPLGELTLGTCTVLAALVFGTGIFFILLNANLWYTLTGLMLSALGGTVITAVLVFYLAITGVIFKRSALDLRAKFGAKVPRDLFRELTGTPLKDLQQMIAARISSASLLISDLFLKRVRELLDQNFYNDPATTGRVKGNRIYDLSITNALYREQHSNKKLEPTACVQKVAEVAFRMGTTLWFDKERDQETDAHACLVACGQFSTCYNLLDYISWLKTCEGYDLLPQLYRDRADRLEIQLGEMYDKFQKDPFCLYNEIGERSGIEGFKKHNAAYIKLMKEA